MVARRRRLAKRLRNGRRRDRRRPKYSVTLALCSSCQRGESAGIDSAWITVKAPRLRAPRPRRDSVFIDLARIFLLHGERHGCDDGLQAKVSLYRAHGRQQVTLIHNDRPPAGPASWPASREHRLQTMRRPPEWSPYQRTSLDQIH